MNIQPFKKSVCFTLTHNNVIPRTPYPFTQECSHVTTPTLKLQKTHSTLDFVLQFCCRLRCTYRGCQSATGSLQAQNFYFIFQYSRWPAAVFWELVSFEPHQKPVPRVQFWQPMSLYSAVESIFFSVPITSIQPSMSCFVSLRKMEAIVLDFEAPWCSESFLGFRTWMQVWVFIEREKQAQRERSRFWCLVFCRHIWGVRCCVLLLRLGHSKLSPQRTVALRGGRHRFAAPHQVYSWIGDFGKSQNKCSWFSSRSNSLLWWHVFVPNWLVPSTWIGLLSHIEYIYIFVFLVLYLKTMSLSSLEIMKKSLITEYSD